jgi:hypothetical protein
MSSRNKDLFRTGGIGLSAAIVEGTGQFPTVRRSPLGSLTFEFYQTEQLLEIERLYNEGTLLGNLRDFETARRDLFSKIEQFKRGGGR